MEISSRGQNVSPDTFRPQDVAMLLKAVYERIFSCSPYQIELGQLSTATRLWAGQSKHHG